jgi:hypothetical protein
MVHRPLFCLTSLVLSLTLATGTGRDYKMMPDFMDSENKEKGMGPDFMDSENKEKGMGEVNKEDRKFDGYGYPNSIPICSMRAERMMMVMADERGDSKNASTESNCAKKCLVKAKLCHQQIAPDLRGIPLSF